MVQDILVAIIILAALVNIFHQTRKLWLNRNDAVCGGCSDCEIKKTIVENVHR